MGAIKTIWGSEEVIHHEELEVTKRLIVNSPTSVQVHFGKMEAFLARRQSVILTLPDQVFENIIELFDRDEFKDYVNSYEFLNLFTKNGLSIGQSLVVPNGQVHCIVSGDLIEYSDGIQETKRLFDFNRGRELQLDEVYFYYKNNKMI